jgi:hypothetical protein
MSNNIIDLKSWKENKVIKRIKGAPKRMVGENIELIHTTLKKLDEEVKK